MIKEIKQVGEKLNKNAQEYVPTKKRIQKEIDNNNLTSLESKPKEIIEYIEADEDEEDEEKDVQEKMDMIVSDMIEAEVLEEIGGDESDDEDKWIPDYRDCECCHGFVFNCKGEACSDLGQCYCKMKDECDKRVIENQMKKKGNIDK